MNSKLFIEFLAGLKEQRMTSAKQNPQNPLAEMGLLGIEAKGNALRKIQQIQLQDEQKQAKLQQLQQMMMMQQQSGGGDPNAQPR